MKMYPLSFAIVLLLLWGGWTQPLHAQRTCGVEAYHTHLETHFPEQAARNLQVQRYLLEQARNHQHSRMDEVYTVPTVFHVVWNTMDDSISEAQVLSQLRIMNEDFRRLNPDTSNTPADFLPVAGDMGIEFCLATFDPDGDPTTGITYTFTNETSFGIGDGVKSAASGGVDAWPTDQYLNVWICNLGGGLLGYATGPGSAGSSSDGVVIGNIYTGDVGTAAYPYHLGRTATHELGHWLGLPHTWGNTDCSGDDGVADTPNAGNPNYTSEPCTYPGPNSCNDGVGDLPDMFQNYMDYSDDACFNLFTLGQKAVMRGNFEAGGARESLLTSVACVNPKFNNVGIDTITSPAALNCGGEVVVQMQLTNYGENVVTETPIKLLLDGSPLGNVDWTGALDTAQSTAVLYVPTGLIAPGIHTLIIFTEGANGSSDPDLANDTAKIEFEILDNLGIAAPFGSGFENPTYPPTNWEINNPDGDVTWQRINGISRWGTASVWMNNYAYSTIGEADELLLPDVDLTTFPQAGLSFWLSYAKYGPNTGFSDTLEVWVSGDCGVTFELRYKKFGDELVTAAPTFDEFVPKSMWDWRREWVDLSDFAGNTGVAIKFRHINNNENNLYLDNINVDVLYTVGVEDQLTSGIVSVFPNPARQQVQLQAEARQAANWQVSLRDMAGKLVLQTNLDVAAGNSLHQLDVSELSRGVYLVEISDGESRQMQKLLLE
ncbi:MAG: T9SS type A sorting domain-containing protein [Bacteroidota bacterium]